MRRRTIAHNSSALEAINVTPMIDVVMCLIVFFLIVSKLAADRGAGVRLPATMAGLQQPQQAVATIVVAPAPPGDTGPLWGAGRATVTVDGALVLNEAELEAALQRKLGPEARTQPVQVRADRQTHWSVMEPVLRACSKAGLTNLRLVTERGR